MYESNREQVHLATIRGAVQTLRERAGDCVEKVRQAQVGETDYRPDDLLSELNEIAADISRAKRACQSLSRAGESAE